MFDKKEKELLIELICDKQTKMIIENPESYNSSKYKELEQLKVKIKDDCSSTISPSGTTFNPIALLEIEIPFSNNEIDNAMQKFFTSQQKLRESMLKNFIDETNGKHHQNQSNRKKEF